MKASPEPAVPVIDMRLPEPEAADVVREACTSTGFFYISNHGLEDLVQQQFEQSRAFFSQPLEFKQQIDIEKTRFHRGYTSFSYETLDPETQKAPDTKEGLYFGREVPEDSEEAKKPLHGPNQWPDEARLPHFRPVMKAYFDGVLTLGLRVMRLMSMALDLPPDWFTVRHQRPLLNLRPLHYSADLSRPEEGVMGCGAHSDYGVLTLLVTDGTPGLQILKDGVWTDVPPIPGTIIVNLGDMLERWTSGKFRSTQHRVVSTSGKERFSTAAFFEPDFDVVVDPRDVPSCCPPDKAPMFPPITSGAYLMQRYDATLPTFRDVIGIAA